MSLRTISVLGAGWLGLPLAAALARAGHTVRGSTTTGARRETLAAHGVKPHVIRVGEAVVGETDGFFDGDVLICAVPPSGAEVAYPVVAEAIRRAAETGGVPWVIMTSSTSVYPNLDRVVEETDAGAEEGLPLARNGSAVLAAERVFWGSTAFETTVLRLAGLYGYDRHPARSLAGRRDLRGGNTPVNLVHRDDVIRAVETVLQHNARGTTFNVCADRHPARRQVYPVVAERLGLEPPTYTDDSGAGFKIVSSRRLKERLDFAFSYPDPLEPAP